MRTKIVIAANVHDSVEALLSDFGDLEINRSVTPWSDEQLLERCSDATALVAFMTERVDAKFLHACRDLRIIAGALKGYNNFDMDACTEHGVIATVVPDLLTEPTAELTVGLIIGLLRNLVAGDQAVRGGHFSGWRPTLYGGTLDGATVGVLGAGAVGRATLRMLSGFNCRRLYCDPQPISGADEEALQATRVSQPELARQSDILILAVHLMPATYHLVDADFIATMKPGAYLINPARGSLVKERDVADALTSGVLAGYAADTFELEDWQYDQRPREVDARLRASDRTFFAPHIGSGVRNVRERIELEAAANVIDFLEGKRPRGIVNPAAWR